MRVCIRVDAGTHMGTGHVMRCLTLATELRARGAEIAFISREHKGHLCDLTASYGFSVVRLPIRNDADHAGNGGKSGVQKAAVPNDVQHAQWLGTDWDIDAEQTKAALGAPLCWDWLVVDHYGLDIKWESTLRPRCNRIFVIDDLADRKHDCDLLLDQNLYEGMDTRYKDLVSVECCKLLGPRYALFRHEFIEARRTVKVRDGRVRRIHIFFGGSDPTCETVKALRALAQCRLDSCFVDVVVGAQIANIDEIRYLASNIPTAQLAAQVSDIAERIANADLAIGACGTAALERCYLGLPTLTVISAANQRELAETLSRYGAIILMGNSQDIDDLKLANFVQNAFSDAARFAAVSKQALGLFPVGRSGTKCVVDTMIEFR